MQIILAIIIFLDIIQYIVFFDVILSWLTLLGINFRPNFIGDILNPIYNNIKKVIPTTIGPIDITPIVIILLCSFLRGLLITAFPEISNEISNLLR